MKITKDKWVWMPHPAHFICARYCRFVMATKVGKYIVSTVGEYWPEQEVRRIHAQVHEDVYKDTWHSEHKDLKGDAYDYEYMKKFGFEDIGIGRKYETMVFKARKMPENGCEVCPYEAVIQKDFDFVGYTTAKDAYKGHLKMCDKYASL